MKSRQEFFKMKLFTWAEIFCVGWAAFNENCPNMEGVAECETNCETNFIECQVNCGDDAQCVSACNRIYATCEASCPCHDNCFEGQSSADENIQSYSKDKQRVFILWLDHFLVARILWVARRGNQPRELEWVAILVNQTVA